MRSFAKRLSANAALRAAAFSPQAAAASAMSLYSHVTLREPEPTPA